MPADEATRNDPLYEKLVQDLQDSAPGVRGWLFAAGAFDKGDLLYLRKVEREQKHVEEEQEYTEKQAVSSTLIASGQPPRFCRGATQRATRVGRVLNSWWQRQQEGWVAARAAASPLLTCLALGPANAAVFGAARQAGGRGGGAGSGGSSTSRGGSQAAAARG